MTWVLGSILCLGLLLLLCVLSVLYGIMTQKPDHLSHYRVGDDARRDCFREWRK